MEGFKNSIYKITQFYNEILVDHVIEPVNVLIQPDALTQIDQAIELYYKNRWQLDMNRESAKRGPGWNKLRTYRLFKHEFQTEEYVLNIYITHGQRSSLAKFRCGVAPLQLETGCYEGLPEEERVCPVCNANTVESEYHAIMCCQLYDDIRDELFICATSCNDNFYHMSNDDKFVFIMSDNNVIAKTVRACQSIYTEEDLLCITSNFLLYFSILW